MFNIFYAFPTKFAVGLYPVGSSYSDVCMYFLGAYQLRCAIYLRKANKVPRTSTQIEIGSGAEDELVSSADRSHPPCDLCRNQKETEMSVDIWVINYGPTFNIKTFPQNLCVNRVYQSRTSAICLCAQFFVFFFCYRRYCSFHQSGVYFRQGAPSMQLIITEHFI